MAIIALEMRVIRLEQEVETLKAQVKELFENSGEGSIVKSLHNVKSDTLMRIVAKRRGRPPRAQNV